MTKLCSTYIPKFIPKFIPKKILKAMRANLSPWLGANNYDNWLNIISLMPETSRLYLEVHPFSKKPRCDIIVSILQSDGSLSSWLNHSKSKRSLNWQKTSSLLEKWQDQINSKEGNLRTICFLLWLEFDIFADQTDIGDPSLFISLTPKDNINDLKEEIKVYPELYEAFLNFQETIQNSTELYEKVMRYNPIALGNIGLMASRQIKNEALPLRSCWRCDNIDHFFYILKIAKVQIQSSMLASELCWLQNIREYINSYMLHLDNYKNFSDDFSLEVNVFHPNFSLSEKREKAILDEVEKLGFLTNEQKITLLNFSNCNIIDNEFKYYCSLHHIKIKITMYKIQEIKCYWLVRPSSVKL
ncbi:hypothetical protein QEJ31_06425 [Pigmentibacter sp. JX0631]|uniref:hypothetical protein n=1 Tax=Pigmentibacter sp. JX0631 TaxID=2976982 RepID=UPI0024689110|nr:hypothetical protein [Pigmentibacter sp. JX0631]WGL61225.1 hypothetical protein QEJ31_06425 [Pigmentibacter sp. JX0631]